MIRYYVVGERASYSPVDVPQGSWKVVSPATGGGHFGGSRPVSSRGRCRSRYMFPSD